MRALAREAGGVALVDRPSPACDSLDVVIDVAFAGVCRTDLAAADGTIGVAEGRVLGHELAGRVGAIGGGVRGLAEGDPVTVIPFSPCGACACVRGARCARPAWLGLDADGAFAERVRVRASAVVPLPRELSLVYGAFVEPVAAALGALAAIERDARVLVSGRGRIAELTARVVAVHGARVTRHVPGEPLDGSFDVAIEHGGDPAALLAALRPGGTLVLKSRAHQPVAVDAGELVARELVVRGASHGSFVAAVDWLHARRIAVDDLLSPPQPLAAFAEVFTAARASEDTKQMFGIAPRLERR